MTSQDEKETSDFDKFTNQALRGPRRKIQDQIIAALLIKANGTNDNLKKVRSICEAAYSSRDKDKLDMNLVELAYTVSGVFQNTPVEAQRQYVAVSWSFTPSPETYKQYVEPWLTIELRYYPFLTIYRRNHFPVDGRSYGMYEFMQEHEIKEATREASEAIAKLPAWRECFIQCEALAKESYRAMKSEFEQWALKKLLALQMTIAEQISSQVYSEVLATIYGEQENAEVDVEK